MLGAEVTDGAVDEPQTRHDGALTYLLDLLGVAETLDMGISAELEVDFIRIVYRLGGKLLTDKRRQISADIGAERELTVGECTRAREARSDMTMRLAVYALLCYRFGAVAFFDGQTLFDDYYLSLGLAKQQLICGENARRTCADDDEIAI